MNPTKMNTAPPKFIGEVMTHENYPMDVYNISEVHWGAHDSSYFLYLVHIDPDAKSKNFSSKEMDMNYLKGKWVHRLALKKGPNRLDHQLGQQCDPTLSLDDLLPPTDPRLCPSPCLTQIIIFLLAVKKKGRDLTLIPLMEYMKYSFDTEDELCNSKSIKQYKSPHCLNGPKQHESGYHLHTHWSLGRNLYNPHSSGKQ